MLAKLTSKNQLTLPKSAVESVAATDYFEVEVRAGQIVLTPVRIQRGDAVRAKLAALGLSSTDVASAVRSARAGAAQEARVAEPSASYAVGRRTIKSPVKPTSRQRKSAAGKAGGRTRS